MIIIGLSGKARGGKGSVVQLAQILMQHGDTEVEVRQGSFATALKEMARERGWDGKKDEKGRTILQDLGMDKRKEDPDYWVKAAMRKVVAIAAESPGTKIVFVPDTRFTNEARAIKFLGGEIWRIERYTEYNTGVRVPYDNGLTPEQKVHPSEIELDNWPFDLTIHSSNMADLFEGVKKALDRLGFA